MILEFGRRLPAGIDPDWLRAVKEVKKRKDKM